MLFLEDYLELVEHLPLEIRDKCTTLRELDLSVNNRIHLVNKRTEELFSEDKEEGNAGGGTGTGAGREGELFREVMRGYEKALEDADEKITVATQLHDLVQRYAKRLDQDLSKFKLELEADNADITETLERKVAKQLAEEETTPNVEDFTNGHLINGALKHSNSFNGFSTPPEKPLHSEVPVLPLSQKPLLGSLGSPDSVRSPVDLLANSDALFGDLISYVNDGVANEEPLSLGVNHDLDFDSSSASTMSKSQSYSCPPSYIKSHSLPKLPMSLAKPIKSQQSSQPSIASLSQQPMNRPKRATSSEHGSALSPTRFSYDTSQFLVPPLGGSFSTSSAAAGSSSNNINRKRKKEDRSPSVRREGSTSNKNSTFDSDEDDDVIRPTGSTVVGRLSANSSWQAETSDQKWCLCNDYSYGNMIACDNIHCPIEWFHYPCVGITSALPTKKKWYCPKCRVFCKKKNLKK